MRCGGVVEKLLKKRLGANFLNMSAKMMKMRIEINKIRMMKKRQEKDD